MRRAARIDATQPAIVAALEAIGCSVWIIGLPLDLLVGFRGQTYLIECKDGSQPASRRQHTDLQLEFIRTWRGGPIATVGDVESALCAVTLSTTIAIDGECAG